MGVCLQDDPDLWQILLLEMSPEGADICRPELFFEFRCSATELTL
jgi:hypothetical protein